MNPIPTLSQCYAMLLQDENQRDVNNLSGFTSGNVALNVRSNAPGRFAGKNNTQNSQNFTFSLGSSTLKKSDSSVICEYCHLQGHTKDICFCVVGYPSWHRLYGKPKQKPKFSSSKSAAQVAIQVQPSECGTTSEISGKEECGLSDTQYKHLLQMLQTSLKTTSTDSFMTNWPSANSVHIAGTFLSSNSSLINSQWIIDSGATGHVTAHLNLLVNPIQCNALLHLPNGQVIQVSYIGTVHFTNGLSLKKVLCVPGFTHNLMFIPKLLKDTALTASFSASSCFLQDPILKKELEIGRTKDGLFVFNSPVKDSPNENSFS